MKKTNIRFGILLGILCLAVCGCGKTETVKDLSSSHHFFTEKQDKEDETSVNDNVTELVEEPEDEPLEEPIEEPAEGENSSQDAPLTVTGKIEGYEIIMNDVSISDELHSITAYASLPRLLGSPEAVDDINEMLEKMNDDYCCNYTADINEWLEMLREDPYSDEYLYSPIDTNSVYWDDNGNVSIGTCWRWYMGGVYNMGFGGINYNYISKRNLTIEEVLGKSRDEIDVMIAEKVAEFFGMEFLPEELKEIETYTFWFDSGMVYVGFESYELSRFGNYYLEIELQR